MEFSAQMIADFLQGKIEGDANAKVSNVSKIEEGRQGTLSFLANPKYARYLYETQASIVLVNNDFELEKEVKTTLIRVKDAYQAFAALLDMYEQNKPKKQGIADNVSVDSTASIAEGVYLGAFVVVGANSKIGKNTRVYPQVVIGDNVEIGENTVLYPGVTVYEGCSIGDNCVIHANTAIGSDGFGFAPQDDGSFKKIPQIGNVIIEDDVELGSNVSVDRATMGSTIIRQGAKLDNLIQIAHNVEIGANTVIASQTGIAGSTKIGQNCMFGGQVGIVGHITIANGVKIGSQAGVNSNVNKEGEVLLGSPATNIMKQRKSMAVYNNLPDMRSRLIDLEREIEKLKAEK